MKLDEFKIGNKFRCGERLWLVTDVGTRIVTAICLSPASRRNDWFRGLPQDVQDAAWEKEIPEIDASWFKGPPYALEEHVFDEYDQVPCAPET